MYIDKQRFKIQIHSFHVNTSSTIQKSTYKYIWFPFWIWNASWSIYYIHTVRMTLYMTMYYIVMYNRISSFDSWLPPTFVIPPILYIQALLVILWAYPITNIWSTCRNTLPKIHESNFPGVEQILWSSAWRTTVANHPPTSHYSRLLPNLKGNQFPWLYWLSSVL